MKHVQTFRSLASTLFLTVFSPKRAKAKRTLLSVAILMFFCSVLTISASAQRNAKPKNYVMDVQVTTGITPFLGDLGGSFSQGKNSVADLDLGSLGSNAGIGFGIRVAKKWMIRTSLVNAVVKGDDKWSGDVGRRERNLSFRSTINEFYIAAEYTLASVRIGHSTLESRVFAGGGVFTFNPTAWYNNQWVALQPLGTEGQGLVSGTSLYKKQAWSIPFGAGIHWRYNDKNSIGIMLNMHKSSTDFIDDVSGTYYDNDALRQARGDMAANLADRSTGSENGLYHQDGAKRGNPGNNDNFAFFSVVYSHSFGKTRNYQQSYLHKCYNSF